MKITAVLESPAMWFFDPLPQVTCCWEQVEKVGMALHGGGEEEKKSLEANPVIRRASGGGFRWLLNSSVPFTAQPTPRKGVC